MVINGIQWYFSWYLMVINDRNIPLAYNEFRTLPQLLHFDGYKWSVSVALLIAIYWGFNVVASRNSGWSTHKTYAGDYRQGAPAPQRSERSLVPWGLAHEKCNISFYRT